MSVCNALTNNVISRPCRVSGGIKAKAWVFQVADLTGANTYNASGALSSFGLAPGAQGITATSRTKKGNGANKLAKGEDSAVSVEQALTLEFIYNDQTELDTLMAFLQADNKTVFVETNAGTIRQYFAEQGDGTLDGDEGTGTLIGDASNVAKVTLKGTESTLPRFFEAAVGTTGLSQLAASRAYLNALVAGS